MSTPSGRPFDPFDLSPYAPKRARERSILDRPSFEGDEREPDEPAFDADRHDGGESDAMTDAHASVASRAPLADGTPREFAFDLDAGRSPRPEALAETPAEPATAEDAGDLARLQSSVRYLRREAGLGPDQRAERDENQRGQAMRERLPRVAQLQPVRGLDPLDPDGPRQRAEQYINGVRVPPSLAPERLRKPRPLRQHRDHLRGPLRVLLASAVAAPIAYYFSVANPVSTAEPTSGSTLAAFASRLVASTEFPLAKEKLRPEEAKVYETVVASRNKLVPSAPAPVGSVASPPVPAPVDAVSDQSAADQAASHQAVSSQTVRTLDDETIKLLLQQGEQLVASGDLVSARQVYQRAAEGGNAAAALALGATFDPTVLARIGMPGVGADVEKARNWYEKAREFGSAEAPRRLETLANR